VSGIDDVGIGRRDQFGVDFPRDELSADWDNGETAPITLSRSPVRSEVVVLVPLQHHAWQVLRAVVRAEAAGLLPIGRDLRLVRSRTTRDGSFLTRLVADGLLAEKGKPEPVGEDPDEAAPLRRRYVLTALGRTAAEYGEYDMVFVPAGRKKRRR
jgi:hypothetical protein